MRPRRRRWAWGAGLGLAALVLTTLVLIWKGGDSMKPSDFAAAEPKLVLEEYFVGHTEAWGIFVDRFGTLRRQFRVSIEGTWDGAMLTLDEHFDYADGEKDRRVWRITRTGADTYEGRADDILGVATGRVAGNALNWAYDMNLKVGDGTWKVHFNDWMWLQPGGVLINRATVSRWGLEIGTVTLFFRRDGAEG